MLQELEQYFEEAGIAIGPGERAFATGEEREDVSQNAHAVLFENIARDTIVDAGGFADLVVPKRNTFMQHKLFSFLAIEETNSKHKAILEAMCELALSVNGTEDNTLLFHVLKEKVSPDTAGMFAIMSVAYLHLWSVQTSAMMRSDDEFLEDGVLPSAFELDDAQMQVLQTSVADFNKHITIERVAEQHSFAPLDLVLRGDGATISSLLLATRRALRTFEHDSTLHPAIHKGVRIFCRQVDGNWESHILTGGPLKSISKDPAED